MNDSRQRRLALRYSTEREIADLESRLAIAQREVQDLKLLLAVFLRSKSWRLTRPLRTMLDIWHRLKDKPTGTIETQIALSAPNSEVSSQRREDDVAARGKHDSVAFLEACLETGLMLDYDPETYVGTESGDDVIACGTHAGRKSPLEAWFS
jgi:hypothetical protein